MTQTGYALDPVSGASDWAAYHAIREAVLWLPRGREGYDRDHPDDRRPGHHPLLLRLDGSPVATVRLDARGDGTGVVRLVAVAAEAQRRGHGRILLARVDALAHELGLGVLLVNAAPDAVGFYERTGWHRFAWDASELQGFAAEAVQMRRAL